MILYNANDFSQSFIHQVQIAYKGNVNIPLPGTANYNKYVAIANRIMGDWMMDADQLWNSLFETRTYGPIVANQQVYPLEEDVFFVSDSVTILDTTGNITQYRTVQPKARNDGANGIGLTGGDFGQPKVYITGTSSNQGSNLALNFVEPFEVTDSTGHTTTSSDVGGTIQLGVYALLDDLSNENDTIMVDNPFWLVWQTAAELARNDPAKQDQLPNLVGMANATYEKMVTLNQGNSFEQPNGPRYVIQQIGMHNENEY